MKRPRNTLSSLELGVEAVVAFARVCFATPKVVVIVGAGISTAQGVPDYRSPGGLFDEITALLFSRFGMTGPRVVSTALSVEMCLEEAQAKGQARYIGVSNYPAALIKSMRAYARVMPCCNQLEFHPRFSSPALCAEAAQNGMVLTAYGSGNSVAIEKSPVVAAIASRKSVSPVSVVLTWTLQHGVAVIPRTANPDKIASNARAAQAEPLSSDDLSALDELNAAHPYYWEPMPCLPRGAEKDLGRSVYRIGGTH